jgi:hypothetical protein
MDSQKSHVDSMPFFCGTCEFPHDANRDWMYFEKFEMCQECAMTLVEARQSEWLSGWRPSREQIDMYINSRMQLIRRQRGYNA